MFMTYTIDYLKSVENVNIKTHKPINDITKKKLYYKKVWELTNVNCKEIENIDKRHFKGFHVDHVVPIIYGYKNNIDVKLIASKDNLKMVFHKQNMLKGAKLNNDSINVLKKWGYEI